MTEKPLPEKISDWLHSEGYPTEFQTAHHFVKNNFAVRQGEHVRISEADAPREIDVMADVDRMVEGVLLRVSHVVECKWSKDKPWVAFCSGGSRMHSSACIAQSFASSLAGLMLWADAGNPALGKLSLFAAPRVPGFGGRQAFSKNHDVFYAAMISVVDATTATIDRYNEPRKVTLSTPPLVMPSVAVVAFPMIVVDGPLFRAAYDAKDERVSIEESNHVRFHWLGASSWRHHASIDLVTLAHAPSFIEQRRAECELLLDAMQEKLLEIRECFRTRSSRPLKITKGPRGYTAKPRLLQRLDEQSLMPRPRLKPKESDE